MTPTPHALPPFLSNGLPQWGNWGQWEYVPPCPFAELDEPSSAGPKLEFQRPPWGDWERRDTASLRRYELVRWDEPRWVHVKTLLEGLVVGILGADSYFHGYQVPPHFERVVNYFASRITGRYGKEEVVELSLQDYEKMLRSFGAECQEYLAWNKWEGHDDQDVKFICAATPTGTKRDFIGLGALVRNAAVYVRDYWTLRDGFIQEYLAGRAEAPTDVSP